MMNTPKVILILILTTLNVSCNNFTPEFSSQNEPKPPLKQQFNFNHLYKEYLYEIFAVIFIFLYILGYQRGKTKNSQVIQNIYKQIIPWISNNFAHIGFTKNTGMEPFIAESAHQTIFYASGSDNVDFIEINFNLRKRQDLLYFIFYEMIYPQKDLVTIDIGVKCDMPVVLMILLKKKQKTTIEANLDVKMLTSQFEIKNIHQSYRVFGQMVQTVDFLIDHHVAKKISDNPGLVVSMHYSDQKIFSNCNGHLRTIINANYKNKKEYLNRINNLKLSANNKRKAAKARQLFNETKQKQQMQKKKEQLQKKKQQKRRKQQAWLRSLPPEKQKKQEQKRQKKQMNKFMKVKTTKMT